METTQGLSGTCEPLFAVENFTVSFIVNYLEPLGSLHSNAGKCKQILHGKSWWVSVGIGKCLKFIVGR